MFSAGMGKRKDHILLLPLEAQSRCQALIFTDGTYANTIPSVYMPHTGYVSQTHGKDSNTWCSSRRTLSAAISSTGCSSALAPVETSLNISKTPLSLCKAGMQAAGSP